MHRTVVLLFTGVLVTLFTHCRGPEGDPGPVGPAGPPGPAGPQSVSLLYEIEFTLDSTNNWEIFYGFPDGDEILPEDVVQVYLLWDQVETEEGLLDVWRSLPVNLLSPDGTLMINYDFTVADVRLFAEATFPLDSELDTFNDLVARIVVIPAAFSPNGRRGVPSLDYADYNQVKKAFNLPERNVKKGKPFLKRIARTNRTLPLAKNSLTHR